MAIDNSIDAGSVMTVVSFVTFIGILAWTFVLRRSADFDVAARTPFADEEDLEQKEGNHV